MVILGIVLGFFYYICFSLVEYVVYFIVDLFVDELYKDVLLFLILDLLLICILFKEGVFRVLF